MGSDIVKPDYINSPSKLEDIFYDQIKISNIVGKEIEKMITNSLFQVLSKLIEHK